MSPLIHSLRVCRDLPTVESKLNDASCCVSKLQFILVLCLQNYTLVSLRRIGAPLYGLTSTGLIGNSIEPSTARSA